MQKESFFSTKKGKIILFGGLVSIIFILVIVLVAILINDMENNEKNDEYQPQIDPISGEMIWNIDEEPEIEPSLTMIGFNKINEFGFMSSQYNKIIETIEKYMKNNFPECLQINYWEDSFVYLDENRFTSSFSFVADDKSVFMVVLSTNGSLIDVNVSIARNE